jgi:predicted DNA-binding transcriptional regulator
VTGEFIPLPPKELIEEIKKSLQGSFETLEDTDTQLWMRQKASSAK